jgi:DsbC/DsbD-like thiol-disulfide interchange protein
MLFLTTMVHSSQFLVHGVRGGLWLILFALGSSLSTAKAQTGLQIQLVSEQTAIVPGKPFTVGLWLDHDRGWHTYWRFPGIVGVPTQLKWNLPKGWKAGELVYPEPERTLMFKIKAQGFDRDVMLRTELTPPANLKIGDQITLTGKASWMCCGNTCHPGSMDLSLTLPVAETAELNSKWHKLLNEERARVEQTSDAWTAAAIEKGDTITLSLKPASAEARLPKNQREADKIIVFTEDGWFDTDKPQIIQRHDDGSLTISLIKADAYLGDKPPKTLRAIVRNDDGWLQDGRLRCLQIAPRIQRGG